MFALEIDFHDGISSQETILVRKTNAIVGSSELAHVVIEGAASSFCDLRLIRGLGREFRCVPVRKQSNRAGVPPFVEGTYSGEAFIKVGELTLYVTSLDVDLLVCADELPSQGAIRILRDSLSRPAPVFPAIAVLGQKPMFVSFYQEHCLMIGRSRKCGLRLDAADVSSEHAKVGIKGEQCWVEDLGSTNGTYVGSEKITSRRYLEKGEVFSIGSEFVLEPILSKEDVVNLNLKTAMLKDSSVIKSYPCIVANSDEIRPIRMAIRPRAKITVGRDPASDIWISASHISRNHIEFIWDGIGPVRAVDLSGNGTYVQGERLPKGVSVELERGLMVLDLCSGLMLAICFSEDDEGLFLASKMEALEGLVNSKKKHELLAGDKSTRELTSESLAVKNERKAHQINGKFSKKTSNVFEKLVQEHTNLEQISNTNTSNNYGQLNTDLGLGSDIEEEKLVSLSQLDTGVTAFEEFQQNKRKSSDYLKEFDVNYDVNADYGFEQDVYEDSSFGRLKQWLVVVLGTVLVLVVCFFLFSIFDLRSFF